MGLSYSHEEFIISNYYEKSTISPKNKIISIPSDKIDYIEGDYCGIKQKFKGIEINPDLKLIEMNNYCIPFNLNDYTKINHHNTKPDKDFVECQYLTLPNELKPMDFLNSHHGIFGLFFSAYCYHKNILLRPDDIWFHILEQIQIIINEDPENLRKYFVNHDGKEKITIEQSVDFKFDSNSIGQFAEQINEIMCSRVKGDFVQITNSNFTTTSHFDKTLYNITTMVSMKKYFDFELKISCGIKKIYFGGELEDWKKIITNLNMLKNFGPQISKYVNQVIPIINEFINAYNGNPNIGYFNRAIRNDAQMALHLENDNGYIIGRKTKPYNIKRYVDGWIKNLYWFKGNIDVLPKEFQKREFYCEFNCINFGKVCTKELVTTNNVGMMYYTSIDSIGMIKSWWIRDKSINYMY